MRVGFTGTQRGMTDSQASAFRSEICKLAKIEFHHGDCIGADAESHTIVRRFINDHYGFIVVHPPINNTKRAFCRGIIILPQKDYLERNHDIVDACDVLIATPGQAVEVLRSGTWATIRYARKMNKAVKVIYPNGGIE